MDSPMRRSLIVLLASVLVAAVAPASAAGKQVAGVRADPSFGGGLGYVTLELSGQSTVAYAAIATSDGIVVAGQAIPPNGDGQVLVVKYDSSGQLDSGFATQGIFLKRAAGGRWAIPRHRRRGGRGRLVVAGGNGQGAVIVLRLTAVGQLDTTFGTDGAHGVPVGGTAQSMAISYPTDRSSSVRPTVTSRGGRWSWRG